MLQTVVDRHDHDGVSWPRIVAREFFDATRVAPLMRWESPMNRIVIVVLAAAVAALVAVAVSGPRAVGTDGLLSASPRSLSASPFPPSTAVN